MVGPVVIISHGSEVRFNQVEVGSLLQKHRVPFLFTSGFLIFLHQQLVASAVGPSKHPKFVDIVNWYRMVFYSSRSIRENHVCP